MAKKSGSGRIKTKELMLYVSGGLAGASVAIANLLFLGKFLPFSPQILYAVAAMLPILPLTFKWYEKFNKKKRIENSFPLFIRDLIETVRSGMSLPGAFKAVSDNYYGYLTPYIKKMASQLNWGIPVDKVLVNFAKETNSKLIGRIVSAVIESHSFGGNLTDTLEALSKTVIEVDRLRKERFLYLQSQVVTGYIVFFVFLAVIIGMQLFLTPSLTSVPQGTLGSATPPGATPPAELAKQYNDMYRNLIIIQGIFAGMAIGKMSEGSMMSGIKHSLFMAFIGFVAFTFVAGILSPPPVAVNAIAPSP